MQALSGRRALALALVCALASAHPSQGAPLCDVGVPTLPVLEAQPAPLPQPAWKARVAELDEQMASMDLSRIRLVFLGDSITQGWYDGIFNQFYKARQPLNLGVLGDNTQGLLWRLARLPLGDALRPQLIVLLIGTNDIWPGVNPANVAAGIAKVVSQIRVRSPSSHILLLGLLPRGQTSSDPFRVKVRAVNALLERCTDETVSFADPGTMLLDGDGDLSSLIEYDFLHPTWLGYAILSAGIEPDVRQVLGGNGTGE